MGRQGKGRTSEDVLSGPGLKATKRFSVKSDYLGITKPLCITQLPSNTVIDRDSVDGGLLPGHQNPILATNILFSFQV